MFSLINKTAAITGAASGIGRAVAMIFSKQEACVHLLDLNAGALDEVVQEIKNEGGNAVAHQLDVTNQQAVKNVFEKRK